MSPRMLRFPLLIALLVGFAAACGLLGLALGHGELSNSALRATLLELRGYRVAVAFLAGGSLAVGGVLVQGLFRNPLASPSVIGTTAGASLGGQIALLLLGTGVAHAPAWLAAEMLLPIGCMLGALLSLGILAAVTKMTRDLLVVLLAGFLLSSLFLSISSFVTTLAQGSWDLGRAVVAFTLGGVGGSGKRQVLLILPLALIGTLMAWTWAKPLDLLLTGEEEAQSLGLNLPLVRRWVIIWIAILTAGAVAVGGNVGFVGLIIPHALRPFTGVGHRQLIPSAAIAGGAFLVLCDVLTRVLPASGEVPLGIITGLIGAPVFLFLLLKNKQAMLHG
ncbi:MAG TPA: iron ABC transporter permease [Polyangiaceae bacterium]|nr:iron ABC transporter permease [Polyangiaceae bacterium]